MKTLIISDIGNQQESIIPYGLNFGKYTETEVDIFHIIDPRTHHGYTSSYADSHSFSQGRKLTHEEILEREKKITEIAIKKLLGKEASRLNYPLKINKIIETDNIEKRLKAEFNDNKYSMVITSSQPNKKIFADLKELFSITKKLDVLTLIVPPGKKFHEPEKAVLFADYSVGSHLKMYYLFKWLKPFELSINACELVNSKKYIEMELEIQVWLTLVKNYIDPPFRITTTVIDGKDYDNSMFDYVRRNNYDMVILSKNNREATGSKTRKLSDMLKKPVLIY